MTHHDIKSAREALSILEFSVYANDDNATRLAAAIQALAEFASNEDSVRVIAAFNADQRESRGRSPADELILKAMNENESDMTVQRAACYAIAELIQANEDLRDRMETLKGYRNVVCCMERFADNESLQALACEALACLSVAPTNRSHMIDASVADLAFVALQKHGTNSTVVSNACKAIAYLIDEDVLLQKRWIRADHRKVLLDVFREYIAVEEVVEQICWALRALVSSERSQTLYLNVDGLRDESTHALVIDTLEQFGSSKKVVAAGCGLLEALCCNVEMSPHFCQLMYLVDDRRAMEVVLNAMKGFPDESQIQEFGCSLIDYLAEADKEVGMANEDVLRVVYEAMNRNRGVENECFRVQEAACRALAKVLNLRPDLTEFIGEDALPSIGDVSFTDNGRSGEDEGDENEDDLQFLLHRTLMYAIMSYSQDVHIFKAACSAIFNMTVGCSRLQNLLVKSGAQLSVIVGMKWHKNDREAQEWGCRALRGLSVGSSESKRFLCECGALDQFKKVLKRFCDDPIVLEEAIGGIACLAEHSIDGFGPLLYTAILDVMLKFQDVRRLQEMALEALSAMAVTARKLIDEDAEEGEGEDEKDDDKEKGSKRGKRENHGSYFVHKLNEAGAQRCVLTSMEKNLNSPVVQKNGCLALCHLRDPVRKERPTHLNKVASAIQKAMERHKDSDDVQHEGCLTVLALTQHDENMGKIFVEHKVHLIFFNILNELDGRTETRQLFDLQEAATECLYLFRDLNTLMLQYAVTEGLIPVVRCLIESMGADVNSLEGNSPICVATSRHDVPMVRLLLKHSVANLHRALEISINHDYDDITGLLLRRIGFNREHGVLSLSGHKFGSSLNPLWLYPSLGLDTPGVAYTPEVQLEETARKSAEWAKGIFSHSKKYSSGSSIGESSLLVGEPATPVFDEASSSGPLSPVSTTTSVDSNDPDSENSTSESSSSSRHSFSMRHGSLMKSPLLATIVDGDEEQTTSPSNRRRKLGSVRRPFHRGPSLVEETSPVTSSKRLATPIRRCVSLDVAGIRIDLRETKTMNDAMEEMKRAAREMSTERRPSKDDSPPPPPETLQPKRSGLGRRDSQGSLMTPTHADVGIKITDRPLAKRRKSLAGTESGANLPFRRSAFVRAPREWIHSTYRTFSPTLLRRAMNRIATLDGGVEDSSGDDLSPCSSPIQSRRRVPKVVIPPFFGSPLPPSPLHFNERYPFGWGNRATPSPKFGSSDDDSDQIRKSSTGSRLKSDEDAGGSESDPRKRSSSTGLRLKGPKKTNSVRHLDVSANELESLDAVANADAKMLRQLCGLEHLNASENLLESFPVAWMGSLSGLTRLDLQHNAFELFPAHVFQLKTIQTIDLSHNKIQAMNAPLDLIPTQKCLLVELDLAYNQIQTFPIWLGKSTPNLTSLNLSHNCIKELLNVPLGISVLKKLNLSHNEIGVLPEDFLSRCPKLDTLDLGKNKLIALPTARKASLLGELSELLLGDNSFGSKELSNSYVGLESRVPDFVLKLPKLKVLDISKNGLCILPGPSEWATKSLSTLTASDNDIEWLDFGGPADEQWNFLRRLNLKKNQLRTIPPSIGRLTRLTSLDISSNVKITKLPLEMGNLSDLWELNLDGLKVDLPCDVTRSKTSDIINMLKYSLHDSERYYRLRLIVLGDKGCGKSKLLFTLTQQENAKKQGIQIIDWKTSFHPKKTLRKTPSFDLVSESKVDYRIHCWEFVGDAKYRGAYQCFKAARAVYMVVFKFDQMSSEGSEVKSVRSWLLNIEAQSPRSTVLVAGTHIEKVEAKYAASVRAALEELKGKPGFPKNIVFLDSIYNTSNRVKALRDEVVQAISSATSDGEPLMGKMVPKTYQSLANAVFKEAKKISASSFPAITYQSLCSLATRAKLTDKQLPQAIQFLCENGVLIHFGNIRLLKDYFILDPAWLCEVVARVKGARRTHDGIVTRESLTKFYVDIFPENKVEASLHILEKFEIALAFVDDCQYLVPCLLPEKKPVERLRKFSGSVVHRQYDFAYVPAGFWSHLIAKISAFSHEMIALAMSDAEKHPLAEMVFWKKGLSLVWSENAFVTIEEIEDDYIDVVTPMTRYGSNILGTVVDHIDSLIEEWYPGLTGQDIHGNALLKKRIPCPDCLKSDVHYFDLSNLIETSSEVDQVQCPNHGGTVRLTQLAPDIVLSDVEQAFHIDDLDYNSSPSCVLGHGGFGDVYKANYRGRDVAVKVFRSPHGVAACHQQLRQEISVLQHRHPSIIGLIGVSLRPDRLVVIELAPQGSLNQVFEEKVKLPRMLQHRIAWQVVEGLAFLHSLRIAYRDLKPGNMLLFSKALSAGVPVNVKLTDFGIACLVPPAGLTEGKGTPSHRAPQVIKRQSYGLEADIYSYGLFLFELVTNGQKLFHDVASQPNRIDDLICQRSVSIPESDVCNVVKNGASSPWPDMQDLINHCLQDRREDRPTAEQIKSRLSKAEFICLREVIPIESRMNLEAIAVRKCKQKGKSSPRGLEVWVASGTESRQESKIFIERVHGNGPLTKRSVSLKDKRICCLLAARDSLILAGTLSGKLWVFDTNEEEVTPGHVVHMNDAVLCLYHYASLESEDYVLAGLGNGTVAKFDTTGLYLKVESPSEYIRIGIHPVTSISCGSKRFWFCHGDEVVVFSQKGNMRNEEKRWKANDESSDDQLLNHLSHVCVGGNQVWTATKQSPRLRCWDTTQYKLRSEINCVEAIRAHYPDPDDYQIDKACRVVSLLLIARESLWVGTGFGHLLLYCPIKLTPLLVVQRSSHPVRCIAQVSRRVEDMARPVNLVLTGCLGFRKRPSVPSGDQSAAVLVWERDFHKQELSLREYQKARNAHHQKLVNGSS